MTKTTTVLLTETVNHVHYRTKVKRVPEVRYRTRTETRTVTAAAPAAEPEPAAAASTAAAGDYSGNGEKNLGTVTVATESVLRWRSSGGFFSVINDPGDGDTIDVASQATSGETTIAAGAYHKVDILSTGDWSFTITPK